MNLYYNRDQDNERIWGMTAFDDTGVIGHFTMRFPDDNSFDEIRFGFVIVDDKRRGQGYGKEMLSLAIQYAFDFIKVKKITLGVFENNKTAIKCYESCGFRKVKTKSVESYHCMSEIWNCIEIERVRECKEHPDYPGDKKNSYGYLMQFADGIRIDLTVQSVNYALQHIRDDKLCKILLDKENILPEVEKATDCQYWVKKPSKEQYLAVCNEFWWCTNNIAKGLWREEIPYVQDMTNDCVRTQLLTMLNWKAGILTGWSVSTGKSSKYLYKWLPEEEWQMLLSTYFDGNVDHAWESVFDMCELFENVAQFVGQKLGWEYNEKEGEAAKAFLEYVHGFLPRP